MLSVKARRNKPQNKHIVSGKGLINWLINKNPLSIRIPYYNYCGPGNPLEEQLANNVQPVDKLDLECQKHDSFYKDHKDTESRHVADRKLRDIAWERFKAKDSSLREKAASYLVTNIMKAKLAMGAGVRNKKNRSKTCGGICKKKKKTGAGTRRKSIKKRPRKKKTCLPSVIALPKTGGILQYLLPLLNGLSKVGSLAGTATELLNAIQKVRGKGARGPKTVLMPYKKGYGLFLKPYQGNF
ncbi:unnamed protein product [Bemisia tabaci]|uniref:Phospholipase A2-like domain-containing protein n=1 Tax=Bemisia tabaci TaxID=7038 RepID=A0A9P0APR4_BEMTA|nr:unnamed protein product [Bemisia tabaci]